MPKCGTMAAGKEPTDACDRGGNGWFECGYDDTDVESGRTERGSAWESRHERLLRHCQIDILFYNKNNYKNNNIKNINIKNKNFKNKNNKNNNKSE